LSGGGVKEAIVLGLLQGVTEFLPVSSSGHLVLLQKIFGVHEPQLAFDTVLHSATMMATLIFFWKDLKNILSGFIRRERESGRYLLSIIAALIPTAAIGLIIEKEANFFFGSALVVGISFAVTGCVLLLSYIIKKGDELLPGPIKGFLIGLVQGLAVIPGISRSGTTIVAGMSLGLEPEESFRFSFLISIPAIAGAMLLNVLGEWSASQFSTVAVAAGFACAFLSGYASLALLKRTIITRKLHFFALYLFATSLLTLLVVK